MWFEGGRQSSPHFTYTARAETGTKVLILSAENYTAGVPTYPDTSGPTYLTYYTDALDANGVAYDIYDVDKRGNRSPDWLGVLEPLRRRHLVHGRRLPDPPAGPGPAAPGTARLAVEEMIDVRHFLNEGGKLFFTGKSAGQQWAEGNPFRNFGFPEPPEGRRRYCSNAAAGVQRGRPGGRRRLHRPQRRLPPVLPGGLHLRRARQHVRRRGRPPVRAARARARSRACRGMFDETGANNQDHSATFVVTSSVLDPAQLPAVRGLAQRGRLAAPGRRAVQPLQRHDVHVRRGRQPGVQAPRQDARPDRPRRRPSSTSSSPATSSRLGLRGRRGA